MFRPDVVALEKYPSAQKAGQEAIEYLANAVADCQSAGFGTHLDPDAFVHFAWSAGHGAAALLADGPASPDARERAEAVPGTLRKLLR